MTIQMRALWRNLIHKDEVDRELDEELGTYVELALVEKVEEGMTPEKAYRDARFEAEGIEQVKQRVRDVRIGISLERLTQDIGYGLRTLVKNPTFSLVAVATLALGIGANSVVYTLMDSICCDRSPLRNRTD